MFGTFRVKSLMTPDPFVLHADDELDIAKDVMQLNRIRHIPVLADRGGALVGVISQRDLFRGALEQLLARGGEPEQGESLRVGDVMSADVVHVGPDTPITDAANLMTERKLGCLPVVEDDELVGILTEGDFVALMGSEEQRAKVRRG